MMQRTIVMAGALLAVAFPSTTSAQCSVGEVEVTIEVHTDAYGYETYWELLPNGNPCGTGTIFSGGNTAVGCNGGAAQNQIPGGYGDDTTYVEGPWCLVEGANYDIEWVDDWGDAGLNFTVNIEGYPLYDFTGTGAGNTFTFEASLPPDHDLRMNKIGTSSFLTLGTWDIRGVVENRGTQTITSFDLYYSVDGGTPVWENVTGVSIAPFTTHNFTHMTTWTPASVGTYDVEVWTAMPNGVADEDPSNDTLSKTIEVTPPPVNIIDDYLLVPPVFTVISSPSDGLMQPRDLAFHPDGSRKELWVINKETENTGGTTVTYWDAGEPGQTDLLRQDGNAWHFMSLPTGIDFGENGNFATSPGVFDANHNGGDPFTGPSLWSSDSLIYALPSGGNGSHLDMLHASPYSQGIAHEQDNVYWVVDGYSNDIVRYDFVDDHGPGGSYHGDAIVYRYNDFNIAKDPADHIVSHCELDKTTGWLYVVDHGNQRVVRMDIHTGTVGATPAFGPFESIVEYKYMTGYTFEDVVTTGLVEPAGIDVIEDRMIVSDHSNGDIIIYDISSMPAAELGRINTGSAGVMGITIGPEGKIWYVNTTDEEVVRIDGNGLGIGDLIPEASMAVFPNPSNGQFKVKINNWNGGGTLSLVNGIGQVIKQFQPTAGTMEFDVNEELASGVYMLNFIGEDNLTTVSKRIVIE